MPAVNDEQREMTARVFMDIAEARLATLSEDWYSQAEENERTVRDWEGIASEQTSDLHTGATCLAYYNALVRLMAIGVAELEAMRRTGRGPDATDVGF